MKTNYVSYEVAEKVSEFLSREPNYVSKSDFLTSDTTAQIALAAYLFGSRINHSVENITNINWNTVVEMVEESLS